MTQCGSLNRRGTHTDARFGDVLELSEEAPVIFQRLGQRDAEGTILYKLAFCHEFPMRRKWK